MPGAGGIYQMIPSGIIALHHTATPPPPVDLTAAFPLALTFPRPVGAVGVGLVANHKVFAAYPGMPYRYFAAAVGGVPPYVWSMSGQPAGMTIHSATGEVTWPVPTLGTHTGITVTVLDQLGGSVSTTYTLTVAATRFRWIGGVGASDSNDGVLPADGGTGPWATISRLYVDTSDAIAVFRAGTYTFAGVPTTQGGTGYDDRYLFNQSAGRSTTWIAYPGESVTLNFQSSHAPMTTLTSRDGGYQPALRFGGDRTYVDGFRFLDGFNKFLWMDRGSGRGLYVINCTFENMGPGFGGSNSACIMFTHQTQTHNDCVVNCTVSTLGYGNDQTCMIKMYDTIRSYVAFCSGGTNLVSTEVIAYKDACTEFMNYRCNLVSPITPFGGNMHGTTAPNGWRTSGEVWYSRYKGTNYAMEFNQDSEALAITWSRCTFEGAIHARQVDANDGPFVFRRCVIVNGQGGNPLPYLTQLGGGAGGSWTGIYDTTRITCPTSGSPTGLGNLAGSPAAGLVDAAGLLQGSYRTAYLGQYGHELV